MTGRTILAALCSAFLMASVAGCGSDPPQARSSSETEVRTTTVGQELMDLKKALDSGAISQSEYEEQREKILDREE